MSTPSNDGDFKAPDDADEARDHLGSLKPARVKANSDMTGMRDDNEKDLEVGVLRTGPRRRKTKSDMVLMMTLPPDHEERTSRRRLSNSALLSKHGYAPTLGYDDLKFAETLKDTGTRRERQKSGLSDKDFLAKVEEVTEKLEDGFELNFKGLTSEEAQIRLQQHGRNELPEKIDPKWLVFLRQFWAPMPIMIWIAIIIELGVSCPCHILFVRCLNYILLPIYCCTLI
jgi:magnesium-transporting ATPase (P-type)